MDLRLDKKQKEVIINDCSLDKIQEPVSVLRRLRKVFGAEPRVSVLQSAGDIVHDAALALQLAHHGRRVYC